MRYVGPTLNGIRDPEYPCDAFESGAPAPGGDCLTDGHYLCDECTRRATCTGHEGSLPRGGCGARPSACTCVLENDLVDAAAREFRDILRRRQKDERRRYLRTLFGA